MQQLVELRRAPGNAVPEPAAPGSGLLVPMLEGPKQPHTFCNSGFFFLTDLFPAFSWGKIFEIQRQLKERPSFQFPPCFGTEFCSWLKFFSFQNANGHFSWKPGIWPRKEAKCENTTENSMLFFHVIQPAPLMKDHRSLDS